MPDRLARLVNSARTLIHDQRAELDEKAILIAFFVIVVAVGVVTLGNNVSETFNQLASAL